MVAPANFGHRRHCPELCSLSICAKHAVPGRLHALGPCKQTMGKSALGLRFCKLMLVTSPDRCLFQMGRSCVHENNYSGSNCARAAKNICQFRSTGNGRHRQWTAVHVCSVLHIPCLQWHTAPHFSALSSGFEWDGGTTCANRQEKPTKANRRT